MSELSTRPDGSTLRVRLDRPAVACVFRGPGSPFDLVQVDLIDLREGDVLVEVELATVCGSDLHTCTGKRGGPTPSVLGHEQVGRVVALGPGRAAPALDGSPLAVGSRVVWSVAVHCGECRLCRRDLPNKCERLRKYGHEQLTDSWMLSGGIATHVHLLAGTPVVVVPDHVPAAVLAPASCATATVAAALDAASALRPLSGEAVLVSGCGMLGLTAVAMAAGSGASVVAVDPIAARRDLAIEFGASSATEPDVAAVRRALAGVGVPGFGAALELSGAAGSVELLFETADLGATIVLAGSVFPAPPVAVEAEAVVRRLLTIRGVHNYAPRHLADAVRFLETADHRLLAGLVDRVVGLDQASWALTTPPESGARIGVAPSLRTEVP
jgi:putative phosphonate catabolism associated alcohol dehydrogenase